MALMKRRRPHLAAVEVLYVRAPGEELEHAARLQALALEHVRGLLSDVGRESIPAEPTGTAWGELAQALDREPTEAERRVYVHKWRNAVTCAWAGWYG